MLHTFCLLAGRPFLNRGWRSHAIRLKNVLWNSSTQNLHNPLLPLLRLQIFHPPHSLPLYVIQRNSMQPSLDIVTVSWNHWSWVLQLNHYQICPLVTTNSGEPRFPSCLVWLPSSHLGGEEISVQELEILTHQAKDNALELHTASMPPKVPSPTPIITTKCSATGNAPPPQVPQDLILPPGKIKSSLKTGKFHPVIASTPPPRQTETTNADPDDKGDDPGI